MLTILDAFFLCIDLKSPYKFKVYKGSSSSSTRKLFSVLIKPEFSTVYSTLLTKLKDLNCKFLLVPIAALLT
jgi:hypothetical protein